VPPADTAAERKTPGIALAASLIGVAVLARLVSLQGLHPLNWDELEFFRATEWVRHGLVPYRDFWEHHTPLQWFLFAPAAALTHSPGVGAIVAMRWAQVPLWIASFWLLNVRMRDDGVGAWARWTAMVLPLTSSLFMIPAVEYRVDTLSTALLILGLVLVRRMERSRWYAVAAGAAFCLCGFANLRLGPVLVLAMLLAQVMRPEEGRWGGVARSRLIFAGAAATLALCSLYFVATGSLRIAIQRLWTDNYVAEGYAQMGLRHPFLHRALASFGVRLAGTPFVASSIDPAGIVLCLAIVLVLRELIRRRAHPDHVFYLAFVTLANILFIARMKYVLNYHFETAALLMVPFVALAIERLRLRRSVVALLIVTTIVNAAVSIFRGKERDTAYQNVVMSETERLTPPGSTVFDGTGWAIHREPSYRYWLMRAIVHILVDKGYYPLYRPQEMAAKPPAAIEADYASRAFFIVYFDLGLYTVSHYLPYWRDLWLPGMSARLTPQRPAAVWIVPADGVYRVYASPRLADHVWFRQPLYWHTLLWRDARNVTTVRADEAWSMTGAPLAFSVASQGDRLVLRKGQQLAVALRAPASVGVFITPYEANELFQQPPVGVTLEASADPQWHVPDLSVLFR
jgi:hypothetical protein